MSATTEVRIRGEGVGVRERPVLFSGPMVRAILDGRKTVTRRVAKRIGGNPWFDEDDGVWRDHWEVWPAGADGPTHEETPLLRAPYGTPGDRLWVRETLRVVSDGLEYAADQGYLCLDTDHRATDIWNRYAHEDGPDIRPTLVPSIFMPRWASRLLLEVVSVRVERLHEITEDDAKAEGAPFYVQGHGPVTDAELRTEHGLWSSGSYRAGFEFLWNDINGWDPPAWDANPWVWRIEFRRTDAPANAEPATPESAPPDPTGSTEGGAEP